MGVVYRLQRWKHRALLTRKDAEILRAMVATRRSPRFRRQYTAAAAGFVVPDLPPSGGIWGICMARNESDIIESTIRHLRSQGVSSFLVVDNGSTDDTLSRLRGLQEEIPGLYVGSDHVRSYHQSAKMTRLADMVRRAGARWVVPFDADEYWFGSIGTLAETLRSAKAPVVRAVVHNAFPSAGNDHWWVDDEPHPDVKSAFRPCAGAVVTMGNHDVLRPGARAPQLRIVHIPWRSLGQLQRKICQGNEALARTDAPSGVATHWRHLGSLPPEDLVTLWQDLLRGGWADGLGWQPRGALHSIGRSVPGTWREIEAAMSTTTENPHGATRNTP